MKRAQAVTEEGQVLTRLDNPDGDALGVARNGWFSDDAEIGAPSRSLVLTAMRRSLSSPCSLISAAW